MHLSACKALLKELTASRRESESHNGAAQRDINRLYLSMVCLQSHMIACIPGRSLQLQPPSACQSPLLQNQLPAAVSVLCT